MRKAWMVAALLVMVMGAQAGAELLTPRILGWEQFFKLDWQADQRRGRPVVTGHIMNDWGFPARNVQLLVEGLDGTGNIVGQRVSWLGSELTPGMRAYFEEPAPPPGPAPATSYRVSVFAWDWVQAGGGQRD
jgi:hypothetical protein